MSLDLATLKTDAANTRLISLRREIFVARRDEKAAHQRKLAKQREYWAENRRIIEAECERLTEVVRQLWADKKISLAIAAKIQLERKQGQLEEADRKIEELE